MKCYMHETLSVLWSNCNSFIFVTIAVISPSPQSLSLFHFNLFFREPYNLGCFWNWEPLVSILEIANYNDLHGISWIIVEIGFVAISVTDFVLWFLPISTENIRSHRFSDILGDLKTEGLIVEDTGTMSNDFFHSLCVGFEQSSLLSNLN